MLILANMIFWSLLLIVGGFVVISIVGALFDCDSFEESIGAVLMLAISGGIVWAFVWSAAYLSYHHVWPLN